MQNRQAVHADRPYLCALQEDADHHFVAMLDAYRESGGLARMHEVLALFRRCAGTGAATLVGWVAAREVISFEWQSQTWLPLFQFRRADMRLQPGLVQVLAELTPVYDPWDLANWFTRPNPWLADRPPVEALLVDLPALLNAARTESEHRCGVKWHHNLRKIHLKTPFAATSPL